MADTHAGESPIGDQSGLFTALEQLLHLAEALDEEEDREDFGSGIEAPGWRDPPREPRR